ncbi:MFS transporter [Demetria terragena]|uniref:MFS transporter n=1 Tax=Demetria terragena TaxID=63959 RepID=UPI000360FF79|nr:MFS transporter [Demetria terragena]
MSRSRASEVLAIKDFRWFFLARLVSSLGSSMAPVALAFAVLEIDNSPSAVGLVVAGRMVALVVFLLIGGVVSDRVSRRVVLQVSHILTGLTQGLVACLIISGHATVMSVLVIECLNGAVSAFTMPAMQGIIPQLVPYRLLQQANSLMSFTRHGSLLLGPAIAGAIVAGPGAGWALAVDAGTYAVAVIALAMVALPPVIKRESSMVADLREGWGEFASRTWLWAVVVAFGFLNAIHVGVISVLGPYFAKEHPVTLGERGWGLVLSAEAVGALVMTFILIRGDMKHPLRAGMIGIACLVPLIMALGLAPTLWVLIPIAIFAGAGGNVFGTGWSIAVMENVPAEAQSRVWSYDMLGSFVAIPIGTVVFGWLAEAVDPGPLVVCAGVAYAALCLATLAVPSVRNLSRVAN